MTENGLSELQQRVLSKLDRAGMVSMAREIVDIPSPTGSEKAVGEYVAEKFRGLGLQVRMQEVEPDRSNVISTWEGSGGGKHVMLSGHMDTCNATGNIWVDGDWLYGPGATNMKGFFAAAYAATKMLLESGVRLKGDLSTAAVVGECEMGSVVDDGVQAYTGSAYRGAGLGTEFMLRQGAIADMAIIGEPTGLRVQCGNAGYVLVKITTFGFAQHARIKHEGVSALAKMLKVIEALEAWEPEYQRLYRHPRMQPVLNVGAISSGRPSSPVVTPRHANLFVHITTIPGTNPVELKHQLEQVVARAGEGDPQFKAQVSYYQIRSGYEIPQDAQVAEATRRAHEQVLGAPPGPIEPTRYSVSSDGPFFLSYGIPAITYGPGGITRSGKFLTRDEVAGQEVLNFENLANCARVYALTALEVCGA